MRAVRAPRYSRTSRHCVATRSGESTAPASDDGRRDLASALILMIMLYRAGKLAHGPEHQAHGTCLCGDVQFEAEAIGPRAPRATARFALGRATGSVGSRRLKAAPPESALASFHSHADWQAFSAPVVTSLLRAGHSISSAAIRSVNLSCVEGFALSSGDPLGWSSRQLSAGPRPAPWRTRIRHHLSALALRLRSRAAERDRG